MANINKITGLPGYESTIFDIEALHFKTASLDTPAQWKTYIDDLAAAAAKITIVKDTKSSTKDEPNTPASATTVGKIYIVEMDEVSGTYTEFITVQGGTEASPTYAWEKIGTTATDLTNYLKKGDTYNDAALSAGSHTHTYTKTTVDVDKTKKLGVSRTTDVALNPTKKYLATTTVTGVSGKTIASKATAGTAKTFATRASSQTTVGNANVGIAVTVATKAATATKVGNADVGTAISIPNVTGNTSVTTTFVNTPQTTTITEVTGKTNGSAASLTTTVSEAGLLTISWTTNTPTAISIADVTNVVRSNASTGTLVENRTSSNTSLGDAISVTPAKAVGNGSTEIYGCGTNTTVTPAVASETKIYGVGGTDTITPYSFSDVDVPIAANAATTVATGAIAATGTSGNEVVTNVSVSTQPVVTISEATGNTGPVNEHITVTTNSSASTGSDGAHTHNVKVNA